MGGGNRYFRYRHLHRPATWRNTAKEKDRIRANATTYIPPLQSAVAAFGYPLLLIGTGKHEYLFTSHAEITAFCGVSSRRVLPRPEEIVPDANLKLRNGVWISRVYKGDKTFRAALVRYIQKVEPQFAKAIKPPDSIPPDAPRAADLRRQTVNHP